MTDRELLELAAKAAGFFDLKFNEGKTNAYYSGSLFYMTKEGSHTPWNPLTDEGDALRLAVKLNLAVVPYPVYEQPKHSVIAKQSNMEHSRFEVVEIYGNDPYAATRRAIVRAAAAIGEILA